MYEVHPNQLSKWKKEAIEGLTKVLEDGRKKGDKEKEALEKNLALNWSRDERLNLVDFKNKTLPITTQTQLLSLNRTSLYYRPVPHSPQEIALNHEMDHIYTDNPYMGYRPITTILNRTGFSVSGPTVLKYMREMGISAIYPKPNLSKKNHEHTIFPYLLRGIKAKSPNHVWGTDITYIRLRKGWFYLVAFMDWFSRYVLAWELDFTLEVDFVLEALGRALKIVHPEIINSDQEASIPGKISMDGRGRFVDNIFTERLWRIIKYQEVYLHDYESPREARNGIPRFLEKYNTYRPHQALHNLTPEEVYYGNYTLDDFQ